MKPGAQIAQSGHAIAQYCLEHPEHLKKWNNNYLICLSTENQTSLEKLFEKLTTYDIPISRFTEPDLGNELTAIAFHTNNLSRKHTTSLSLALKQINI